MYFPLYQLGFVLKLDSFHNFVDAPRTLALLLNPFNLSTKFLLLFDFCYRGVSVPCVTSLLAIRSICRIVQYGS
jgi:hypothetical protein